LRCANEDPLEERNCLQKLQEGGARGLILIAENYSHENLNLLQEIKQKMPIVIVDVEVPGLETDLVVSDDLQGGFLITSHLIELGHRKILHLAGPEDDSSAKGRLTGYQEALKKYDIEFQPELVRFTDWHSEEGYYETKKALLNSSNREKVTAIFACNDEVATGTLKALTELNFKVPDEIALAGYGNLDIGRLLEVPLTTVNQFPNEMGKVASQLLLGKLTGSRNFNERKEVKIPTKLVIRKSCGIQGREKVISNPSTLSG
jgi:DNA-binding LacI/PurR family transcriptional regulator